MKIIFLILMMITTTMLTVSAKTAPPLETGVSQTLARWRAANYSDVRYKLNITLEKNAPLMRGEIEISVKLTDEAAKNDLILDWRTTQFANDKDKPYADVWAVNQVKFDVVGTGGKTINEHLIISKKHLKSGENTIKINFASPIKTSGSAITRYVDKEDGAEYIYSLFVPSDASTAFPVFDQPDLKARFQLGIRPPYRWKVVSNTAVSRRSRMDPMDWGFFDFEETKPISTYVFAFAAGEFEEFTEYDEKSAADAIIKNQKADAEETKRIRGVNENPNIPPLTQADFYSKMGTHIYVRKSQADKFKQHAAEVFRLNREGVKFLESYFDYKFPFPKYDLVLIPEFPFGGMEHAGATFLKESSVIFPTEPTKNDLVSRANVIFHEAAHQWFGDTVTMKWFDDLWLKEGFAEIMAYKTLERVMPEYNAWKIFYERNKQAAYLTDSTRGTTPIYQEIPNLSAAKSAYGNIVYRKAPSFLKQAEFYLGEKEFQTAVRAFLKKHEFANAEWTDLVKEFETASKQDLKDWANVWVKQRGVFKIKINYWKNEKTEVLEPYTSFPNIEHTLGEKNESLIRFKVLFTDKNGKKHVQDYLKNSIDKLSGIGFLQEPVFVFPNYQDYGYGIFLLDEKSRDYVLKNIQNEKDDFLRAMMWGALWDSVREGELNPKDYVELVVKNINVETDESTIQTLLGRVSTAMNYYLSDAQRDELAPKIEAVLIGRIRDAKTTGQKITFFRSYLNIASTDYSQRLLKQILKSDGKPVELETFGSIIGKPPAIQFPTLKTKDKFDIVTKLLILENKKIIGNNEAEKMLAELEKTETSDEAKRYAYAAKAGIASAENKQKFWTDFTMNKEISESWIEAAFENFNSPRHSDMTLPYLERALAELPNLKKNRKIFFVNGWLAVFIGGQKSVEALQIVNKFLAGNPNLDKDLRLKILENADGLERAVKIRAKFGNRTKD